MKKSNKHMTQGMSIGMCLGISVGMMFGLTVFDNIGIGMCFGLSIGMSLGMAIGAAKDNEIFEQMKQHSYTIKEISEADECGDYVVTIADKDNNETTITVLQASMEEDKFSVGDLVYMDEDGNIGRIADEDKK